MCGGIITVGSRGVEWVKQHLNQCDDSTSNPIHRLSHCFIRFYY